MISRLISSSEQGLVKRMNYMKPRAPCTSLNNNRCIKGVEFSRLCAGKGSTSMKHPQCSLAFCSFILVPHGNGIWEGRVKPRKAYIWLSAVALMQRRMRYFQTVATGFQQSTLFAWNLTIWVWSLLLLLIGPGKSWPKFGTLWIWTWRLQQDILRSWGSFHLSPVHHKKPKGNSNFGDDLL